MNKNYLINKINIYVPEHIIRKIDTEAQIFEIFKKDGSINKNKLLNMLLKGYFNTYTEEQIRKQKIIENKLYEKNIKPQECVEISHNILKDLSRTDEYSTSDEVIKPLSLKTIKDNISVISSINEQLKYGESLSEYLRDLLCNYFQKPFSERERILFRENYDTIRIACKEKKAISFSTIRSPEVVHTVLPYSISTGPEEMYNYVLCCEKSIGGVFQTRSYRLNRIISLNQGYIEEHIPETMVHRIDLMNKYGPAYAINDDEESCVKLTEDGVEDFNSIYTGRPKYISKVEQGKYTYFYFECSQDQLFLYFKKFEQDKAVIVAPESLKNRIIDFHLKALEAYNTN